MRLIDLPSPNHGPRLGDAVVNMLVLHYTGMRTAEEALNRLRDPEAQVSAHYVIDEDGTVYRLVHEKRRAWHAGVSCWRGQRDVNSRSIGIELVNPGHEFGYRPFPEAQMQALEELAVELVRDWAIPPLNVVGHSDVAPARKTDPGEMFDWPRLAAWGIGAWPRPEVVDEAPWTTGEVLHLLSRLGYDLPPGVGWDGPARLACTAFQRHWQPGVLTGEPDDETVRRLRALLRAHDALASARPGA